MLQCAEKSLQRALTAVATVLLLYSRTAEPTAEPNSTHSVELLTHDEPLVLAMHRPCGPEHNGYCLHGRCSYAPDLNEPSCLCDQTFSGPRCEHYLLDSLYPSQPEEIIGITCGVLLLMGCITVIIYVCYKKRCWKSSPPYKNYGHENSV
ncbi:hypothetical protein NFI96_027791 [Prochilodus magdalenae]|nr:hypothetical protein NFI96_027791 [Prochilodus magdalenae]